MKVSNPGYLFKSFLPKAVLNSPLPPTMTFSRSEGSEVLAALNMVTLKKITALTPDNCWPNISIRATIKGFKLTVSNNVVHTKVWKDADSYSFYWILTHLCEQARKSFRPPIAMWGIGYFQNLRHYLKNI